MHPELLAKYDRPVPRYTSHRTSLGAQVMNPEVQRAINRWQPLPWWSVRSTG
jgi:hypothetical protein